MLSLLRLERASPEGDIWADVSPEGHEIHQVDVWGHQLISARTGPGAGVQHEYGRCGHVRAQNGWEREKNTRDRSEESQEPECSGPC